MCWLMLCYWQFLLTPVKTFVSDLNSPQIHAVTRENERLINARVSFVFLCGHLYFFFYHGCSPIFPCCCHCLQPWQQPKTFQSLRQVTISLDNYHKPQLPCVRLDLDLGQD